MALSDDRGQASVDYVGALAVVAIVLGAAAATVSASWLAPGISSGIRHGICLVAGGLCTPGEAREAGLAPCPIHRRSNAERLGAVALIRLERGDTLLVERRSDGTASVSFVDGASAGVEAGVGVTLPGAAGTLTAGAGVGFASGQTFDFADWTTAQRFLARFAREETLTGEGRRLLRRLCWRCPKWLKGAVRELPDPSARYLEGGTYGNFAAQLGLAIPRGGGRRLPAALDASGRGAVMIGRRTAGRRVTWYIRLQADVVASLGAVMGSLHAARGAEGVLEVTAEDGTPVQARVRASAAVAGAADVAGLHVDVAGLADRLRRATTGVALEGTGGLAIEAAVSLDLRDPANLRALEGVLQAGASPLGWLEHLRALARRLDVAGAVDVDLLRLARVSDDHALEGGQLVRFGGGYGRVEETRDLIAAWSLRAGGVLRRREDCEAAARSVA